MPSFATSAAVMLRGADKLFRADPATETTSWWQADGAAHTDAYTVPAACTRAPQTADGKATGLFTRDSGKLSFLIWRSDLLDAGRPVLSFRPRDNGTFYTCEHAAGSVPASLPGTGTTKWAVASVQEHPVMGHWLVEAVRAS